MRNILGIIFYVVAGVFLYIVNITAFVNDPAVGTKKWIILTVLSIPVIVAQLLGLVFNRFQNWKRDTGIVLLCAAAFTAFIVFTVVCLFFTDEFRRLMKPGTLAFFGDYVTGAAVIVLYAGLGGFLVRESRKQA